MLGEGTDEESRDGGKEVKVLQQEVVSLEREYAKLEGKETERKPNAQGKRTRRDELVYKLAAYGAKEETKKQGQGSHMLIGGGAR